MHRYLEDISMRLASLNLSQEEADDISRLAQSRVKSDKPRGVSDHELITKAVGVMNAMSETHAAWTARILRLEEFAASQILAPTEATWPNRAWRISPKTPGSPKIDFERLVERMADEHMNPVLDESIDAELLTKTLREFYRQKYSDLVEK